MSNDEHGYLYHFGDPKPHTGSEDEWVTVFENPHNNTVYKGIQGHCQSFSYTPDLARNIKFFGHYQDEEHHIFYKGIEYQLPTEFYMTEAEILDVLWGHMRFHHIWYDDLGFDFSL